jgi:hypothetical protein
MTDRTINISINYSSKTLNCESDSPHASTMPMPSNGLDDVNAMSSPPRSFHHQRGFPSTLPSDQLTQPARSILQISTMQASRFLLHTFRSNTSLASRSTSRFLSASFPRFADSDTDRRHVNADAHGEVQKSKPNNPHTTNTTSTMKNDVPSVGADKAPPDMISSVDPEYAPKDDVPENTERITGGTQPGDPNNVSKADLGVGEIEGAKFKVEPLRRTGEDSTTMRARLLCPLFIHKCLETLIKDFFGASKKSC